MVELEFLVEPFSEGQPGPHVEAAIGAVAGAGLAVEVGPFGTTASGSVDEVAGAVASLVREAFAAGASRLQVQVRALP